MDWILLLCFYNFPIWERVTNLPTSLFIAMYADFEEKYRKPSLRFWTAGEWIVQDPPWNILELFNTDFRYPPEIYTV